MPKAKPSLEGGVIVHRIELQEKERESLDMIAASMAVKNIGSGVGSIIDPFLRMSTTGFIALGTLGVFIIDSAANNMEQQLQNDPESVPTMNLFVNTVWNTVSPFAHATDFIRHGGDIDAVMGERVTYMKEVSSRGWNWLKDMREGIGFRPSPYL
jgi:hypothetical protein